MTSNETTGNRPSLKGEFKYVNGELMHREEGMSSWKKATRVGSHQMEIDGKLYDINQGRLDEA